jgi:hypothetical protein
MRFGSYKEPRSFPLPLHCSSVCRRFVCVVVKFRESLALEFGGGDLELLLPEQLGRRRFCPKVRRGPSLVRFRLWR